MTGLATSSLDVGRADAGSFAGGVGKLSWYSFRLITGLQNLGGVAASQMAESNQAGPAGPRQCFLGFPLLLLWEVAERCEKEDIHEANRLAAGQSVCRAPVHGLRPQRRREACPAGCPGQGRRAETAPAIGPGQVRRRCRKSAPADHEGAERRQSDRRVHPLYRSRAEGLREGG